MGIQFCTTFIDKRCSSYVIEGDMQQPREAQNVQE